MISMYVDLVKSHKRTCDPTKATISCTIVPKNLIKRVIAELKLQGYDANGDAIGSIEEQ